ncbi:ComF family protein [Synechococcus sp. CS-1325]|uniref:ComF family protein n=1 Tax=Synechococcus sp. CS-1325 TaxID=2847979 RepID=UPI000DB14DA7|nr:ComF family protein [Synechococcus sp. CS-1325]MCT0198838.1 ComF family protein [Synechococcus sp. CS-1325]PZV00056.1 MAG: glycosyltransferase [Cyanobium sp.]
MIQISSLLKGCLELITLPTCALCHQPLETAPPQPLCRDCHKRLELPGNGLQGEQPLPWWSLGWYQGSFRQMLLGQRRTPRPDCLRGLARALRQTVPAELIDRAVLVAIPSWKKRGSNPLPDLICQGLDRPEIQPLRRRRPTLGQHHLNRAMRLLNQENAFVCEAASRHGEIRNRRQRPVLLVDDILTTGATAGAAASALQAEGFLVAGLLCLARTPAPGRDLRSMAATAVASRDSSVGRAGD